MCTAKCTVTCTASQSLPLLHKVPWVFTYNSWSAPYDYMLKGAVRSAAKFDGLKP